MFGCGSSSSREGPEGPQARLEERRRAPTSPARAVVGDSLCEGCPQSGRQRNPLRTPQGATGGWSFPTLTIVALALRIGDELRRRLPWMPVVETREAEAVAAVH